MVVPLDPPMDRALDSFLSSQSDFFLSLRITLLLLFEFAYHPSPPLSSRLILLLRFPLELLLELFLGLL